MSASRITYCQTTWPIISAISLYKKNDGINKSLDALQLLKTLDSAIEEGDCACAVYECGCAVHSESPACSVLSKFKFCPGTSLLRWYVGQL